MVNQTVSIPGAPNKLRYFRKNLLEFKLPTDDEVQSLYHAIGMRDSLKQRQKKESEKLMVKTRDMPTEHVEQQTKIWLRIAKERGIQVESLIDQEYEPTKALDRDNKRVAVFREIESEFSGKSTDSN